MPLFLCGILLLSFFVSPLFADETIIIRVILNYEKKGDFFVLLTDEGDFLVKEEDFKAMGIPKPEGEVSIIDEERYLSVKSLKGVESRFNEKDMALELTGVPGLFERQKVDFRGVVLREVYRPRHPSAFLNYGITYTDGDSIPHESSVLTNELGFRLKDLFFFTDTVYTDTGTEKDFTRLMSNITYDSQKKMTRLVAGDFIASSGDFGSALNMAGLSYSKVYRLDPYFLKQPALNIEGFAALPSDYEVYLDGSIIKSGRLSPGEFAFGGIYQVVGAKEAEVVLRDPFGRETRFVSPFYFTSELLAKGLHEYSYNMGFMREDFGVKSASYRDVAFMGWHNYGLTDYLTAGFGAQAAEGFFWASPRIGTTLPRYGLLTAFAAISRNVTGDGYAGALRYEFSRGNMSARLFADVFTKDYTTAVSMDPAADSTNYSLGGGVSYGTARTGNVSVNHAVTGTHGKKVTRETILGFTKGLLNNLTLSVRGRMVKDEEDERELLVSFSFYPYKGATLAASNLVATGKNTQTFQAQKTPPLGRGYGARLFTAREETADNVSYTATPSFQYNSEYGIYRLEYSGERRISGTGGAGGAATESTYKFAASGAVVTAGGLVGFTRPVHDGFGIVRVGDLEDITVYVNNQPVGRTNEKGYVFIPSLHSYYTNEVRVKGKEMPMEYYLPQEKLYVSPLLRSGACVDMGLTRVQAVSGVLVIKRGETVEPIEYAELTMEAGGNEITVYTERGGEFWFENYAAEEKPVLPPEKCSLHRVETMRVINPGVYRARIEYQGRMCSFTLEMPESDEMIVDLGEIICEEAR